MAKGTTTASPADEPNGEDAFQKKLRADLKKIVGSTCDPNDIERPNFYGTGIPTIDWAMGGGKFFGGFPAGHLTEVYGMEASGKTSLLYAAIAHTQRTRPDLINVICDYEHTTDENYIKACGVQYTPNLLIPRPETMEQGIELLLYLMKTGRLGIFGIDSFAAMNPGNEIKKKMLDLNSSSVAVKARFISEICRLLTPMLSKTQAAVVFINHEIANIGADNKYAGQGFQPATVTPGGKALKYYSSMRVQTMYKAPVNEEMQSLDGKEIKMGVGKRIGVFVEKFKFGNPHQKCEFIIRAGEGIDTVTPILDLALENSIVQRKGGWHVVTLDGIGEIRENGRDTFRQVLKTRPDVLAALTALVNESIKTAPPPQAPLSELENLLGGDVPGAVDWTDDSGA